MGHKALRWAAGFFLASPLLTMTAYYLMIGLGTVIGIFQVASLRDWGSILFAVLIFAVPLALLAALARGYYRYFASIHADAPPALLGSLLLAAAGWWAGAGVFLLGLVHGRTTAWLVLMFAALLGWALITLVAFRRHRRQARWTLLGAPFALYAPIIFLLATALGSQVR